MAMIRVQSRAVRAISLMETFRRYEHRTLVLWDECHSRLSLFPILGYGAKHSCLLIQTSTCQKATLHFFAHLAASNTLLSQKWNLYDFPDIQNFLNDVNSAWINIHWKKARTNLLLFSVGEKGFQVRRKHFSFASHSVWFGNSYIVATKWVSQSDIATTIQQLHSYSSPSIFWLSKRPMFNA